MHSVTINIHNDSLVDKVMWLLDHLKNDGLEVVEQEDIQDLKLLATTRDEKTISFEEYLKNEN